MLDETFRLLDDHLCNLNVPCRGLVKGRGDDFAFHRPAHIGDFLGSFIDQENDEIAFGVVFLDRRGDILQEHGLAGARRRNDQGALALADRGDDVDDPARPVLLGGVLAFHLQPLLGIKRGEIVEMDLLPGLFRLLEIDPVDICEGKIALIVLRGLDRALDRVAGPDIRLLQDFGADIDVIGPRKVIRLRRAQEAETVAQDFEHALSGDLDLAIGQLLKDGEQHVLGAHRGGVLDFELLGIFQKLFRCFGLQLTQRDACEILKE